MNLLTKMVFIQRLVDSDHCLQLLAKTDIDLLCALLSICITDDPLPLFIAHVKSFNRVVPFDAKLEALNDEKPQKNRIICRPKGRD